MKNTFFKNTFSPTYKRTRHPFINRLIALWRVLTKKNIILIDFYEFIEDGEKGRMVRPLYRTNYGIESEILTLKAVLSRRERDEKEGKV